MTTTVEAFDPVPGSNVTVYFDYRGRTYRVEKLTSYEGGEFQDLFGDLGEVVVEIFNSTVEATLRKVEHEYDPDADLTVDNEVETLTAFFSPPVPYTVREIDGSAILASDRRVFVSGKALKSDSIYALHELQLR